jgi:hypothetical protein
MVFKRYLPATLADRSLQRRLTVMTSRPVQCREAGSGHLTLAWPAEVVQADGRFAGFLMPEVDMGRTVGLHRITNPTDRAAATGPTSWTRDFTWQYLVRTAANLARATAVLHQAGVVVGDFNESNIRAWREARVTLLDCDSMQIRDASTGERFFCRVGRPEFTAPELAGVDWAHTVRHPSSDLFALAIHLYQLLLEGEHPFRGRWRAAGEKPAVSQLASQGIWAHQQDGPLQPRRAAIGANLLPAEIMNLLRRAFEDGATDPLARPTAAAWHDALDTLAGQLRSCAVNAAHVYPGSHQACPWCQYVPPPPPPALPPPRHTEQRAQTGRLQPPRTTTIPGRQPAPAGPAPGPSRAGRAVGCLVVLAAIAVFIGAIIGIHLLTSSPSGNGSPVVIGPSPTRTLDTEGFGVTAAAFSSDGSTLAVGDVDDSADLWNAATGHAGASFAAPGSYPVDKIPQVSAVAFNPGGTILATAVSNGSVYLWDIATGHNVAVFTDPRDVVTSPLATPNPDPVAFNAVAFSPSGMILVAGDADGSTYLWDVATGHLTATFTDPKQQGESVSAVAFSPNGATLATADGGDENTYLWDVGTGRLTATLADFESPNAVAFSPSGATLVVAENYANIQLWNTATGRSAAILDDPHSSSSDPEPNVTGVSFSATGTTLASCDALGYTSLWDMATRHVVATFTDPNTGFLGATAVTLSPGGTLLATGDSNGSVYVWSLVRHRDGASPGNGSRPTALSFRWQAFAERQ